MTINFRNAHTGQVVFREYDDGKLDILDPEVKEAWEAQERIEESVKDVKNITEGKGGTPRLPVADLIEAQKSHDQLHRWFKDGAPEGWTQEQIEQEHDKIARIIVARGWKHYNRKDALDKTVTGDLAKRFASFNESDVTSIKSAHEKLHQAYSETKAEKLESLHTQVVVKMLEMGIDHIVNDKLDDTLSAKLKS